MKKKLNRNRCQFPFPPVSAAYVFFPSATATATAVLMLVSVSCGHEISPADMEAASDPYTPSLQTWKKAVSLPDMVEIPGGPFLMGETRIDLLSHNVDVPTFYIAKHQVTNGEFKAFADAAGYQTTSEVDRRYTMPPGMTWKKAALDGNGQFMEQTPVVFVTYRDALAYCAWLSERTGLAFRFPTEAEWEKAARGKLVGALYVLGDEPPKRREKRIVGPGLPVPQPTAEDKQLSPPNGYGIFNMAGYVCDWTSSLLFPYPYVSQDGREDPDSHELVDRLRGKTHRVIRGGRGNVAQREALLPYESRDFVGFRLACSERPAAFHSRDNPSNGAEKIPE